MQFSYDMIIKDTVIINSIEIIEDRMYRFISPICLSWFFLDRKVEDWAIPWGPISSCHPRSSVREERNKE